MYHKNVKTESQAFVYMIDCTLATVTYYAGLKSRGEGEYKRQIDIAQKGIDWAIQMKSDLSGTRAESVVNKFNGSVKEFANEFDVKLKCS